MNNSFKNYKIVKHTPKKQEGGAMTTQNVQLQGSQPLNQVQQVDVDNTQFEYQNRMSIYNPSKLNYMAPSRTTEYTIPEGTILYHGTMTKESFNPYDIRLGDDNLVAYFSPNKKLVLLIIL